MRPRRSASSQSAGPHPVVAGGRRVALVEDEVDRPRAPRTGARRSSAPRGHLERDARLGERALGADDPLRDRRLRDEERARDLLGRQAAEQAQRERDARLGREHRVAGDEHEAQQVVADVVVERGVEVRRRRPAAGRRARDRAPRACARGASRRRSRSIARCLAVAMSQAPGLSGTPDSGHCSSAATSASCARSSARPTSRTIRARPAISRADSIRQTASIARWVSEAGAAIAPLHRHLAVRAPALG